MFLYSLVYKYNIIQVVRFVLLYFLFFVLVGLWCFCQFAGPAGFWAGQAGWAGLLVCTFFLPQAAQLLFAGLPGLPEMDNFFFFFLLKSDNSGIQK